MFNKICEEFFDIAEFIKINIEDPYIEIQLFIEIISTEFGIEHSCKENIASLARKIYRIDHATLWHASLPFINKKVDELQKHNLELNPNLNLETDNGLLSAYPNAGIFTNYCYMMCVNTSSVLELLRTHFETKRDQNIIKFVEYLKNIHVEYITMSSHRSSLQKSIQQAKYFHNRILAIAIINGFNNNLALESIGARLNYDMGYSLSLNNKPINKITHDTWQNLLNHKIIDNYTNAPMGETRISFKNCILKDISPSIPELFANTLNVLNLSGNKFDKIPEFISQLSQLQTFIFLGNPLKFKHERITCAESLTAVIIESDKLKYLPNGMKRFGISKKTYEFQSVDFIVILTMLYVSLQLIDKIFAQDIKPINLGFVFTVIIAAIAGYPDLKFKNNKEEIQNFLAFVDDIEGEKHIFENSISDPGTSISINHGYKDTFTSNYLPGYDVYKLTKHGAPYFAGRSIRQHMEYTQDTELADEFERLVRI